MPRRILCPHCRLALHYEPTQAGAAVVCRYCGEPFLMPRIEKGDRTAPSGSRAKSTFVIPLAERARNPAPVVTPVYPLRRINTDESAWEADDFSENPPIGI